MKQIQFKKSYIFRYENYNNIPDFLGARIVGEPYDIVDTYINQHLYIRHIGEHGLMLIRNSYNKQCCEYLEEKQSIDYITSEMLVKDVKLKIIKKQYILHSPSDNFTLTLDVVESPMRIVILEIKSTNNNILPTSNRIFNVHIQECPSSQWNFFKQKIGICGAPSSGKTELSKSLGSILSTQFAANVSCVYEYATSFIQKYNIKPNCIDQFMIWYSQQSREQIASTKSNIIFSDSPTFLSYIYMLFNNKKHMDKRFQIHLTKLYKRIVEDIDSYSNIIYLRQNKLIENNIRYHTQNEIEEISKLISMFLHLHNIKHIITDIGNEDKLINDLLYINVV